jgi:hypothetical protein
MAAPISTDQAADLAQYKDIITYLAAILNREASVNTRLEDATITNMNLTINNALDNVNLILADTAEEEPTTTEAPTTTVP